jgi:hypothetical protein
MRIRFLLALVLSAIPSLAHAQRIINNRVFAIPGAPGAGAAPGNVNLPYQVADASGSTWMIYHLGWLQQQGNVQIYSQGAMITVNGAQPSNRTNKARLDDKTGEVVFEDLQLANLQLTRRIFVDKELSQVRYVEIIKNPQAQEQTVSLQISSNINYGISAADTIEDPRKNTQAIAWVGQTGANKCALEIYAGKGTHVAPTVNYQQGNSTVQAVFPLTIPAGKQVALVHLHSIADTIEAGTRTVQTMQESKLLRSLPVEIRKIVVNFPATSGYVGDREILRGDLFDVVEIKGGDQMKGTLKEPAYKLDTFYGTVQVPADRVVSLLNIGDFRPRQLLVTTDGEVFGGKLQADSVSLELSSGQITKIPLSQITRVGYRKRAGEPEEWTFDKPYVLLRTGDHVAVQLPAAPIDVITRYGSLKLDPKTIATLGFQNDDQPVHEIYLADGSHFAGLVNSSEFAMALASPSGDLQQMKFPASAVSKIQLGGPPPDVDPSAPQLQLINDDLLVGSLAGQMKLDTAFDTLTINANEIKKLARAKDAALDVQITLWDSSIVSGQLQDPTLHCQLKSGLALAVPISLLEQYNQPQPQPGASVLDKIKALVVELNADDWKNRDKAEADLTALGSVVTGTLKQLRAAQPPEAQQRIDQILATLSGKKEKP